MSIDPKYLILPETIEDAANFLADTFFPKGEIDPVQFQVVMQWVMNKDLTDEEVIAAMEKFYVRMLMNAKA